MISNKKGFTLIEVMIVVAIIAIITSIAYPGYQQYVTRAKRAEAKSTLLELAQWMERYYTENGRYHQDTSGNALTAAGLPFTSTPREGGTTTYNITFAASTPTATTFTLVATPTSAQNDTDCGILSLNHTGVKCINNGASCSNVAAQQAAVGDCW